MLPRNPEVYLLKPYTLKELAVMYNGVCVRTLNRWLKPFEAEIGKRNGRYYNVNQVKIIFSKLGYPEHYTHSE